MNRKIAVELAMFALVLVLGAWGLHGNRVAARAYDDVERHRLELDRFRMALDDAGSAVIRTDFEGNVEFWDSNARDIFGWAAGEAIGKNIHDDGFLMGGEFRDRHTQSFGQVVQSGLRKGQVFKIDCTANTKSGGKVRIHFATRVVDGGFQTVVDRADNVTRLIGANF